MSKRWYVIHTYSGYENKVKTDLEHRIETYGLESQVVDIKIPTEEVTEVKEGGKSEIKEAKVSHRLKTHPVCLTAGEGFSFEMEKYFKNFQMPEPIKAELIKAPVRTEQILEHIPRHQRGIHHIVGQGGLPLADPIEHGLENVGDLHHVLEAEGSARTLDRMGCAEEGVDLFRIWRRRIDRQQ